MPQTVSLILLVESASCEAVEMADKDTAEAIQDRLPSRVGRASKF